MGKLAAAFRDDLCETLPERLPELDWTTEYPIRRTPVDVVGRGDRRFVAVELEWRRADPANNTAKLFYYLSEGDLDEYDEIVVCQAFSGFYDLRSGGVSSKREVAEFVGRTAADSFRSVSFHPVTISLNPPKRGGSPPDRWPNAVDETASAIASIVSDP